MPARRLVLNLACLVACSTGLAGPAPASAQAAFPTRPVTLVVPFPPGGGGDTGGRMLAEQLGRLWGQTVVVENKGGAAGQIGADLVAQAKPDGFNAITWLGVLAPAGTPEEVVDTVAADRTRYTRIITGRTITVD